jgi:signal transduction histidine kinase
MGLAPRLLLADVLVIVAGAGTLFAVAVLIAPALFHAHLQAAQLPEISESIRGHVDSAFDRALLLSLAVGVTVATVVAALITWLVARRLAAPVHDVAAAAQRLADGHYDTDVPDPRLGPEFRGLAESITRLSRRLATTEADRRRLTSDLAHQLRTPLASVRATVEALDDGLLAPDPSTLAVLTDQTDRLSRLVDDLERASRAQERQIVLHPEPQPLSPVVERCVDAVRGRYRAKGVRLTGASAPGVPALRIDAGRLAEAITNVLDNALRHTPPGGQVTVSVRPLGGGPTFAAEVTVEDTGDGFSPDQAERVFERFYRGPDVEPGSGSGLGLTIAWAIAEAHGGALTARSAGPGQGAVLTLVLPAR